MSSRPVIGGYHSDLCRAGRRILAVYQGAHGRVPFGAPEQDQHLVRVAVAVAIPGHHLQDTDESLRRRRHALPRPMRPRVRPEAVQQIGPTFHASGPVPIGLCVVQETASPTTTTTTTTTATTRPLATAAIVRERPERTHESRTDGDPGS